MEVREKEVESLQSQALALSQEDAGLAEVDGQQRRVTNTFSNLQEPFKLRRQQLLASKEAHQFNRDLEDEIVSCITATDCNIYIDIIYDSLSVSVLSCLKYSFFCSSLSCG